MYYKHFESECIFQMSKLFTFKNAFEFVFLVRRDESPENYCHSPGVGGVVVVVVVVRRQKL